MATASMKERLRLAAARCIVHRSVEWWNHEMTEPEEFLEAEAYIRPDDLDFDTPEDAANFLLLCAEAL